VKLPGLKMADFVAKRVDGAYQPGLRTGLDSTSVKVHPDGAGHLKNGPQAIGKSRGGWNTDIHLVAADARTAITWRTRPTHTETIARKTPIPHVSKFVRDVGNRG
jgi:hypothetical protein